MNTKILLLATLGALLVTSCVTRRVKTSVDSSANLSKTDALFVDIAPAQVIQARRLLEPIESVMREEGFRLVPKREARYIVYSGFAGTISKDGTYGAISMAVFPLKEGGDKYDPKHVWEGAVRLTADDFRNPRDAIRTLLAKFGSDFDGTLPAPKPETAP